MIAVLHTWGQNLCLHPHLHCLVPNGGFIPELNRWVYPRKKRFIFPVRVMSRMFRGKFIQLLKYAHQQHAIVWKTADWSDLLKNIAQAGFNVFSKMGFPGPEHIIKYLARYSHRVTITNQRIIDVNEQTVSFRYKDYRDGKQKILKLSPEQFTQRFLLHVLPKGFAKIRYYGILASRDKTSRIEKILYYFERRRIIKTTVTCHRSKPGNQPLKTHQCPICKQGQLISVDELKPKPYPRGSPEISN
jgi:hypothetical protein